MKTLAPNHLTSRMYDGLPEPSFWQFEGVGSEAMRAKSRRTRVAVGATIFALIAAILLLSRVFRYVVEQWI